MSINELAALVHKVRGGCSVTVTSISVPDHKQGMLYGYVTIGHNELQRTFASEEELREILERHTR